MAPGARVVTVGPIEAMTGLRCATCREPHEGGGVARGLPPATVVACRGCGGTLEPAGDRHASEGRRERVIAVRSAVTGRERLPIG